LQTQDSEIPDSTSGPQRSLQTQDSEIPDSTSGPQRLFANSLYLYLGSDSKFQSWPQGPQGQDV
jgi:SRSO17 transposase